MNATANGRATRLCDPTAAADALRLIVGDGVTELRALDATTRSDGWPSTQSGYFDDADKLAAALEGLTTAKGVYFTPNPVDPALLARAANRIRKTPKGESTQDTNIVARKWLLIDCDPQRPSGISSTDAEHQASLERAQAVDLFLHDADWPDPIYADSGNGSHLLYRIDLPAGDGGLVQRCLAALAARFDDDGVKIDRTVYNPSRIWKLYGSMACKGDDTPERPHRMSRIINAPEAPRVVRRELLEALAAEAPQEHAERSQHNEAGAAFDVAGFIASNNFDVSGPMPWRGSQGTGARWEFNTSPMCEHGGDGPFILQHASGAWTAGCHHNSCGWTQDDLRARFEPKRKQTFDGGDRWTEKPVDPPPAMAPKRSTLEIFDRYVEELLSRKKKPSFLHADYGSRLKEFELVQGHVTVLAAPPALGKTSFIGQTTFNALTAAGQEDVRLLIANVEMPFEALCERELARKSGIGKSWLSHRDFVDEAIPAIKEAIEEMRALMPRVEFMAPPFTLERLVQLAEEFDPQIIVCDYLQRIDSAIRSKDSRSQVNAAMDVCRQLANQGRVVIAVSAVNRQGYSRDAAGLASFRESSELEYGADSAWLLIPDEQDPRKMLLKCVKNRHGQLSEIPLLFDGSTQSFTDDKADMEWNG